MCVCVKGMALVPSASCLSQWGCLSQGSYAPSGEFPLPVPTPVPHPPACPWSWAPGWGQEVFPTPTPPLASAQPSCARRAGCTFPYLQHKTSLFLHPGHVPAQSAGDGRRAGDRPCRSTAAFPRYSGDPLCISSNGGDLRWGPQWPKPLVPPVWREICVWQAAGSVGSLHVRAETPLHLASDFI